MSRIQNRHNKLDQEILEQAKSDNIKSLQQKVEFQKKLKNMLDKKQIEEEKHRSNDDSIESDALYQALKTDDKKDLLQKLSDRTMTQEEYIQLSEEYNVNQDVVEYEVEYEIEGASEKMKRMMKVMYDKMHPDNKPYPGDLEKLQAWKGLDYREEAGGKKIIDVPGVGEICSTMNSGTTYKDIDKIDNLEKSKKFIEFASTIEGCEMMGFETKLMNAVVDQLGITDTIDENYINTVFKQYDNDENLPLNHPLGRVLRALYMMTGKLFFLLSIPISVKDGGVTLCFGCDDRRARAEFANLEAMPYVVRAFAKIRGSL